jgi:DNA-binding NarL/FixJ family response regulator
MYSILMVDDHAMVRRGLKAILEEGLGGVSIIEAGTAQEGLLAMRKQDVDAVVLDIGLPDRSGLDVLKRIRQEWPQVPVLILSMYSEDQYGLRMMRAGAAGYLTKSSAPENLVAAVRRILGGGRYVSPALAEKLVAHLAGEIDDEPYQQLSDREYQVFRMIASGKTVSEIAKELCLSVKTISTHRARVLEKTGMKNNAEITHYAMAKGLVE